MSTTITPQVGKRYVTRGGWVTPVVTENGFKYKEGAFDLISEYVEPTGTVTIASNEGRIVDAPPDTFRRDLIARIYCELVMSTEHQYRSQSVEVLAKSAISIADTLIEAMEATP